MITRRTIISGFAGPIFAICSLNESVLGADDDLDLFFPISQEMLKLVAMATNFGKNGKLPSFVALAFQNGMEYRYLNVRIDSVNDAFVIVEKI